MDEIRIWIEFLANIAGACGLLFFLYDYRKDKKEEKSKIDEMEKNTKLAISVILNRALLKWNVDDYDDAIGKIDELVKEDGYSEKDFKLAVIKDLLLEIIRNKDDYEDQGSYISRVKDIESAVKQLCNLVMEQAAIYNHVIFRNQECMFIMKTVEIQFELELPRTDYWLPDSEIAEEKSVRLLKYLEYFLKQSKKNEQNERETKLYYAHEI